MPKKIYKRKVKRAPYKKRAMSRSKVSVATKRYVKRVIHSQAENKGVNINSGGLFGAVTNSAVHNVYPLTPLLGYWSIGQGVTQSTRTGNSITPRKVMLSYVMRPAIYNLTSNPTPTPCVVDCFLGWVKRSPSVLPTSGDFSHLFANSASSMPASGNLNDLISSPNRDYFHIAKRWQEKIGLSAYTGTGSTQPGPTQFSFYQNNDFKMHQTRRIDVTKYISKKLVYNDGDATSHKGLFFWYQAISADGQTLASTTEPINIDFFIDFQFEDV